MDWLPTLDPETQRLLFGATQSAIGGTTAQVVVRLLTAGGYAVSKPFKASPQSEALHRAVGRAMHATAVALAGGDVRLRDDYLARLKELAENGVVAGELANLLLPEPRPPDIAAMREALEEAGYQADPQYPPATLDALFATFAREFANAAGQEPLLQGALQIRILTGIASEMEKVASGTSRVASAVERIGDAVAPLAPTLLRVADKVAPDPEPARRRYLEYLAEKTRDLPFLGRSPEAADAQARATGSPCLTDIYIALDVRRSPVDEHQRIPVLAAFGRARRAALLGDPGSGKSTFVNHLVHCLACTQIDPRCAVATHLANLPREWRGFLPVRILLREMAAWMARSATLAVEAGLLREYFRDGMERAGEEDFFEPAWDALRRGRSILLLDGWDEVSESDPAHPRIRAMLEELPRLAGGIGKCPILVTCRVRTYEEARGDPEEPVRPWRLDPRRWPDLRLVEFDEKKRDAFVGAWYAHLERRGELDDAAARADRLRRAIRRPDLRRMAGNPLLLTMMAMDHADKGELPDARSVVYEDVVDLLLWKWRKADKKERDGEASLQEHLRAAGRQEADLRRVLARIAFEAHEPAAASGGEPEVSASALLRHLRGLAPAGDAQWSGAEALLRLVRLHAGLLVPAGSDTYAFPHRTFQEYLAACHLCSQRDLEGKLVELARRGPLWREVVLLSLNRLVQQNGETARPFFVVRSLCTLSEPAGGNEASWRDAALAAECLLEIGAARAEAEEDRALVDRVRQRIVALLEGEHLDVPARVRAGSLLGALGDPRDLAEMVFVPAGAFTMGDGQHGDNPQHDVTLDAFLIRKYPVTNQEYAVFVAQTDRPAPPHWGGATPPPELRNHPVMCVSWHDAWSYCEWAGSSLPTEAQWEKAARGTDGRFYPWGIGWETGKCTNVAQNPDGTTPVGAFPSGASPYGCLDMLWNVWEWCADWYGEGYYRTAPERNPAGPVSGRGRVSRGGDFGNVYHPRVTYRSWRDPDSRASLAGFRCVRSAP